MSFATALEAFQCLEFFIHSSGEVSLMEGNLLVGYRIFVIMRNVLFSDAIPCHLVLISAIPTIV